jgi:hypothetical protein
MSYRKIYGGTPVGNESRCDTCTQARIIQGYAESERIVLCDAAYPPIRVPFSVRQCSMYEDKRLPDFDDMEEIAWPLISKSAGNRAGFVLVSDVRKAPTRAPQDDQEKPPEAPAASSQHE